MLPTKEQYTIRTSENQLQDIKVRDSRDQEIMKITKGTCHRIAAGDSGYGCE